MYSATGHQAAADGAATIELDRVTRRFGSGATTITALDDVSFEIAAGSMVALMGPSGSGKSTLLQLIGALDAPDAGRITVGGVTITAAGRRDLVAYRRRTGFVFQRFHLLPALTALDNVLAPVLPYRVEFDKVARAEQLLAEVGLGGRGGALPSELSGGEQQRVAIARALIGYPHLLLADEPTGNLDSATGAEVMALIATLRAEHSMTVLVATHDPGIAARADRVIHLYDGAVTDDTEIDPTAAPEELLARINELRQ
ncbi:MAG TPA: ABC transporter ATP-binding protein [Mycobacteriales bacterium]|nr:ABC transporter ATP-binding protein [Mycobacteriales bacterium]